VNDVAPDPLLMPFTFHWYTGSDPPFVGTAVNVTGVPMQKGLTNVEMVMMTGIRGNTTMLMLLEMAGLPVLHKALDVRMQTTTSP
jgi:hypothetical protein